MAAIARFSRTMSDSSLPLTCRDELVSEIIGVADARRAILAIEIKTGFIFESVVKINQKKIDR